MQRLQEIVKPVPKVSYELSPEALKAVEALALTSKQVGFWGSCEVIGRVNRRFCVMTGLRVWCSRVLIPH
jgi:hypothetical protein